MAFNRKRQELEDEIPDHELVETYAERLIGLGEMFPEPLRKFTSKSVCIGVRSTKSLLSLSKIILWGVCSTAAVVALPAMFETERAQIAQQQTQQQRELILGPNAMVSGSPNQMANVMQMQQPM